MFHPIIRVLLLFIVGAVLCSAILVCHFVRSSRPDRGAPTRSDAAAEAAPSTPPEPQESPPQPTGPSGDKLLAANRFAQAAEAFAAQLQRDRGDQHARHGLAKAQEKLGQVQQAWDNFSKVCRGEAGAEAHRDFARFALARLRADTAIQEAQASTRQEPGNIDGWLLLTRAYLLLGDAVHALASAEAARGLDADAPDARVLHAQSLYLADQLGKAETLLRELLSEHPKHGEAAALLGMLAEQSGNTDEAAKWFAVAGQAPSTTTTLHEIPQSSLSLADPLGPRLPGSFLDPAALALRARLARAELLFQKGERETAIASVRELARAHPNMHLCQLRLARLLLRSGRRDEAHRLATRMADAHDGDPRPAALLADIYLEAKLPSVARAHAESALRLAAGRPYPAARKALAVACNAEGQPARAAQEMAAYLDRRQNDMPARLLLATFQMRAGHLDKARAVLRELRQAGVPEWVGVQSTKLWQAMGDTAEAIQCLRELQARNGESLVVCNDLAFLLASQGQCLEEAIALARTATRLAPDNLHVADTLGYCLLRSGDATGALPMAKRCVDGKPSSPVFRYHLALALHAVGQDRAASEELRTALALSVPFPEADRARRLLEQIQHR